MVALGGRLVVGRPPPGPFKVGKIYQSSKLCTLCNCTCEIAVLMHERVFILSQGLISIKHTWVLLSYLALASI